jgi:2-oxoglutarate/2-oxoacid ferredoxin oxidoreductase subunit beta
LRRRWWRAPAPRFRGGHRPDAAAAAHRGTALVEIFQDCPIFNDGSFDLLRRPETKEQRLIPLTAGEPIRFGPAAADDGRGAHAVVRDGFGLGVAKVDEIGAADIVIHDPGDHNLACALSRLSDQDLDHTVTGIFRDVDRTTYDDATRHQVRQARDTARTTGGTDLQALLSGRDTWTVAGPTSRDGGA